MTRQNRQCLWCYSWFCFSIVIFFFCCYIQLRVLCLPVRFEKEFTVYWSVVKSIKSNTMAHLRGSISAISDRDVHCIIAAVLNVLNQGRNEQQAAHSNQTSTVNRQRPNIKPSYQSVNKLFFLKTHIKYPRFCRMSHVACRYLITPSLACRLIFNQ